ncbi:MAG: hypothetical protein COA57_13475 [Flavobacteriales bacterium]|nr:MAG: hypothetical protein COA57_13475 [Flavobacteriales bacterium]
MNMRSIFTVLLLGIMIPRIGFAQVFFNSGEIITLKNNAVIQVNGDASNNQGKIDAEGNFNVSQDIINNDSLIGTGFYRIGGDWINNDLYSSSSGTVELNGANQNITGTVNTTFNVLTLSGTGIKTMTLDASVSDSLHLNDRELATDTNTMFVLNPDTGIITRNSGFVSSLGSGKLSRAVNSINPYLFPVGSSLGVLRYRPLEITPSTTFADTFQVRMANVDATVEGFDRSLTDLTLCLINPDFYHRINRTSGTSPVEITIYYDDVADGSYSNIAHWQNVPQWENTGAVSIINNTSPTLSYITKNSWNDFSYEPFALASPGLLSAMTNTDVTCGGTNDGTATTSISGGQTPFSYLWSDGQTDSAATGLSTGTYYVTVTDGSSCTVVDSAIVNATTGPIAAASSAAVCGGGSNGAATVIGSGGTAPYTYLWSGGGQTDSTATGLTTGMYYVTVTDNSSCTAIDSVSVTSSSAILPSIGSTDENCGSTDGTATVSATGGVTPYSYLWSDGQTTAATTGLVVGTYNVTVTDSIGCDTTASVIVNGAGGATLSTTSVQPTCKNGNDGSATVSGTGGLTPYTYLWSGGQTNTTATGLNANAYSVTVTDANSCASIDTISVTDPAGMTLATASADENCGASDGTTTVTASGGPGGSILTTEPFNSDVIDNTFGSGPTNVWWSPSSCTVGIWFDYTASTGCPAGEAEFTGNWLNFGGCFLRSPAQNCTGSDSVTLSFDFSNSYFASQPNDKVFFNMWIDGGYQNASSINGTPGYELFFSQLRTCQQIDVVFDLSSAINKTAVLFYINSQSGYNNGNTYYARVDNINLASNIESYTYQWDSNTGNQTTTTATGLSVGTYQITVTDGNSCTATDSVTVSGTGGATLSTTSTNATCGGNNGTATVTGSGGITPYTYLWSDGQTDSTATGLQANTYNVTVTDVGSCSTTTSVIVGGSTAINPTVSTTDENCAQNDGVATVSVSGTTTPYSFSWSDGQTDSTATGLSTGNYSITITDAQSCDTVLSVTINGTSGPLLSFLSTNITCNGDSTGQAGVAATSGSSPYTYLWSDGQTDSTATGLIVGNYSVTITDNNGCVKDSIVSITEPSVFSVSATTTNDSCGGNNGSATVSVSGATSPYIYLWSDGQTNSSAAALLAGIYTVTITDASSCDTVVSVTVNGGGIPVLLATSANIQCNGDNDGTSTVVASGGTTPYNYLWPDGQSTAAATGLSGGTYTVTVTDAASCTNFISTTVNEPPAINLTTSSAGANCGINDGSAALITSGGTSPYSFLWSDGQTDSTATGLGAGSYDVTVTDDSSCTETASVIVNGIGGATLSANSTDVSCFGETNGSATVTASGGITPYTYLWDDPLAQNDSTVTGLFAGNYNVTVVDSSGCPTIASVTINEPFPLSPAVSTTDENCGQADGTASVIITGGVTPYTYLWSNGQSDSTATGLAAGSASLTVTDANSCDTVISVTIGGGGGATIVTTANDASCNGINDGTAVVTASGGIAPYSYSWSDGQTDSTATGLAAGSYQVTVIDSAGCISTDSATISQPAAISVSITGNASICTGDNTTLVAFASGATAYVWSIGDSASSINVSPLADTTYFVTAFVGNCSVTDSVLVTVEQLPVVLITGDSGVCMGGTAILTASGGTSYSWNTGDTSQTITAIPSGTTNYTVTTTNTCGSASASITVNVFPLTNADAGNDTTINEGDEAFLNASGGVNYQWEISSDLSCANCQSPEATPAEETTYYVTVTDANACSGTDSVTVSIIDGEPVVYLPNIFSPNDDGENDGLYVMGEQIDYIKLMIYDRWGEKVFETDCCCTETCGWDGTYRGKEMNTAAFVYILEGAFINGDLIDKKGNLMLIR